MAGPLPVIFYPPPSPTGGRRVRVDGEILGLAHSLRDVAEFLRRAGLEGMEADDVARSEIIVGGVAARRSGPSRHPDPTAVVRDHERRVPLKPGARDGQVG